MLTTHILDTAQGCPGRAITVRLFEVEGEAERLLVEARTNDDGRCDAPLIGAGEMAAGRYRLAFHVGDYFRAAGVDLPDTPFLDVVRIDFGIADTNAHYHVPLLISPYGYSTYRGS